MREKINNKKNSGFHILKASTGRGAGIFGLIIGWLLSCVSAVLVFQIIFSGFNIQCDFALMRKIIIIAVSVFTLFQLNTIAFVLICCFTVYKIYVYAAIENKDIIKNGVMTMINQCYPIISAALNLPSSNGFDKVMDNTYLTVNTVGGICAVIISITAVAVIIKLRSIVLYGFLMALVFSSLVFFGCEINGVSAAFLAGIFVLTAVLRLGNIKSCELGFRSLLTVRRGEKIRGRDIFYAVETALGGAVVIFICILCFNGALGQAVFNKAVTNEYSENIKVTARDIAVMKYAEYKNYDLNENVNMGQLGYLSCVKPDFDKTSLIVEAEPVREGKEYFISFVGSDYKYRYNSWTEDTDNNSVMVNALKNVGADEKRYTLTFPGSSKFIPYYCENKEYEKSKKNKTEIDAYKYKYVKITDEAYNNFVQNTYLSVDDENRTVIEKICNEQGFDKNSDDIDNKIKEYFKSNYTYSLENNVLPYGKDFVNYFLEESKSGNFAHFASAAVLMYRSLGIPARYVSGYAVEAAQTMAGERISEGKTSTRVNSGNIYSWVEVYSSDGGWRIVDIAPSPGIEELEEKYGGENKEEYTPDTSLENYFRTVDWDRYTVKNAARSFGSVIIRLAAFTFVFVIAALFIILLGIHIYKAVKYKRSSNSKKAYILMERLNKRYKITAVSYMEAGRLIAEKTGNKMALEAAELGEKCMFSENASASEIKRLEQLVKKL